VKTGERTVGEIREEREAGRWRVAADVADLPLWFESADLELAAVTEAFGSALLIPALHQAERLRLVGSVSREWVENISRMLPILAEWWDYPEFEPRVSPDGTPGETKSAPPGEETALCFTGGVDSFYSLLRGGINARLLVFIHGYDINLEDEARLAAFRPALEAAAGATGARPALLRTNLRRHPVFDACSWERTHGGALAAVGHLLTGEINRLLISATLVKDDQRPWGSHSRIDHLWSSDRLRVEQCGAERWRHDKLRAIMDEPLVREHLRVCWENRSPAGNCSNCDKCVMTMVVLAQAGRLAHFRVFAAGDPSRYDRELAARLDELPRTIYVRTYALLLEDGLDRRVAGAVRRLLDRSLGAQASSLARRRFPGFWPWKSRRSSGNV
jgi:hypothetical protein